MGLTRLLLLQVVFYTYSLERAHGGGVCPNTGINIRYHGSRCFSLITTRSSWLDANRFCSNSGAFGRLINVDSESLNDAIKWWLPAGAEVSSGAQSPFWIGGYSPELINASVPTTPAKLNSTKWLWKDSNDPYITDQEIKLKKWSTGQPANGTGSCIASSQDSWYAVDCANEALFMCEYTCSAYIKVNKTVATIQSDNFPFNYPEWSKCEWFVEVAEGKALLYFENFFIDWSQSCVNDYILIKEMKNSTDILGRYCGKTAPKYIISPSNKMYIYFASAASTTFENKGFRAKIKSSTGPVVAQLTGHGIVTSPNFPLNYSDNSINIWQLSVSGSIMLKFTDFNLQPGTDGNCTNDRLIVRDMSLQAKVLGVYCGSDIPGDISSQTGGLTLQMITDKAINSSGFRAVFWSAEDTCTQVISAKSGSVASPGYPNTYSVHQLCGWYIDVLDGVAKLEFVDFDIPFSTSCIDDGLQVLDGYTSETIRLSSQNGFCGFITPPKSIKASSRYLTLLYKSTSQIARKGFSVTFASSTECSYNVRQSTGTITSPEYPSSYDPYSNCSWSIDVTSGTAIFQVDDLDLEPSLNCANERLEIYDGNSTGARLISTLCTSLPPLPLNTTSQYIFVRMITGKKVTRSGFSASFWSSDSLCPSFKAMDFEPKILAWNNTCYGVSISTYSANADFCEIRGMDPVSVETIEEMQALQDWLQTTKSGTRVWTGGFRKRSNSTDWFWSKKDGAKLMRGGSKSSLWMPGFPTTQLNAYIENGKLGDQQPWYTYPIICEISSLKRTSEQIQARKTCSPPPKIISGTNSAYSSMYESGSTIKYSCDEGFKIVGEDTIQCSDGLWLNEVPYCALSSDAQSFSCAALPSLQNANYSPKALRYPSGSTINIVCSEGYKMMGKPILTCVNGQWKDIAPMCVTGTDAKASANTTKDKDSLVKANSASSTSTGDAGKPKTGALLQSKSDSDQHTVTLAVTLSIIGLLVIIIIVGVVMFFVYKKGLNPHRTLVEMR